MRVKTVPVYSCEYCNKKMFRKHAMENHELLCKNNPVNSRDCHDCKFIETVPHVYYVDMFDGESERKTTMFRCTKLDKLMYPFSAEKRGLVDAYPETFEGQEAMPNKCSDKEFNGFEFN